jgi:short-subunit dehydrogenase
MAEKVLSEWGGIEVLINNVGQYLVEPLLIESDEGLEKMMNINFYPAYFLSKFFGSGMVERKKGHIIQIVSIAGKEAVPEAGAYSISKFALLGLSKNLRKELKPFHVQVTDILPGSTYTGSWSGQGVDPQGMISPGDIAQIVQTCLSLSPGGNMDEVEIRPTG